MSAVTVSGGNGCQGNESHSQAAGDSVALLSPRKDAAVSATSPGTMPVMEKSNSNPIKFGVTLMPINQSSTGGMALHMSAGNAAVAGTVPVDSACRTEYHHGIGMASMSSPVIHADHDYTTTCSMAGVSSAFTHSTGGHSAYIRSMPVLLSTSTETGHPSAADSVARPSTEVRHKLRIVGFSRQPTMHMLPAADHSRPACGPSTIAMINRMAPDGFAAVPTSHHQSNGSNTSGPPGGAMSLPGSEPVAHYGSSYGTFAGASRNCKTLLSGTKLYFSPHPSPQQQQQPQQAYCYKNNGPVTAAAYAAFPAYASALSSKIVKNTNARQHPVFCLGTDRKTNQSGNESTIAMATLVSTKPDPPSSFPSTVVHHHAGRVTSSQKTTQQRSASFSSSYATTAAFHRKFADYGGPSRPAEVPSSRPTGNGMHAGAQFGTGSGSGASNEKIGGSSMLDAGTTTAPLGIPSPFLLQTGLEQALDFASFQPMSPSTSSASSLCGGNENDEDLDYEEKFTVVHRPSTCRPPEVVNVPKMEVVPVPARSYCVDSVGNMQNSVPQLSQPETVYVDAMPQPYSNEGNVHYESTSFVVNGENCCWDGYQLEEQIDNSSCAGAFDGTIGGNPAMSSYLAANAYSTPRKSRGIGASDERRKRRSLDSSGNRLSKKLAGGISRRHQIGPSSVEDNGLTSTDDEFYRMYYRSSEQLADTPCSVTRKSSSSRHHRSSRTKDDGSNASAVRVKLEFTADNFNSVVDPCSSSYQPETQELRDTKPSIQLSPKHRKSDGIERRKGHVDSATNVTAPAQTPTVSEEEYSSAGAGKTTTTKKLEDFGHSSESTKSSSRRPSLDDATVRHAFELVLTGWERYLTMSAEALHVHEVDNARQFRYNDDAMAMIRDRGLEVWRIIDEMQPAFCTLGIDRCLA